VERSDRPDGGPLRYRVAFRAELWEKGAAPRIETRLIEGDPSFSV
jgi:alkaline phosphatase D